MKQETEKPRSNIGWGIPVSILLHAVFAGVLFFHLPLDFSEPREEEAVQVELVSPPEEEKQEEKQEEQAAQEPPPEQKPEEPKPEEAAPPPPPPPSPQAETPPAEPPPPQAQEQPEEQAAMPQLDPVFQYGEKDTGPKLSNGNASEEAETPATPYAEQEAEAEEPAPAASTAEEAPDAAEQEAPPLPDDINLPEVDVAETSPERDGTVAPGETSLEAVPVPAERPKPQAEEKPAEKPLELTEAKRLFSQNETGSQIATRAMGDMPRGLRAGQLCSNELAAQLRNASYNVMAVPRPRLPEGTVLNEQNVGFFANDQWYDLSFRCVIDEAATKVVSFAFKVGAPVPRREWRARGFQ
ncbi:DUF930 domain-containing protein [Rhizobium sp. LC145]|uniref:DUF930 domain-containing protein n=1 Tax=Rhizobium sp. LC145 TaxID=1120688 RepID=UPI000629FBE1|nr:DUF930 domain-containing protein [Rhizobium sp. LC145]KKX29473.1 hypothetical protein YH62_17105 [Rhizobium sp. LC145]TKT66147.1 DUF930 domain-containing protein [Rhizobiaceae bacterium LC148]